jgi:hypothetical protein
MSWVGAETTTSRLVTSGAGLGISAEVMVNAMGLVHRFRNERNVKQSGRFWDVANDRPTWIGCMLRELVQEL